MLRPQMLEAIFVAGSVFAGMTGSTISWGRWPGEVRTQMRTQMRAQTSFGYKLVSARQIACTHSVGEPCRCLAGLLTKAALGIR